MSDDIDRDLKLMDCLSKNRKMSTRHSWMDDLEWELYERHRIWLENQPYLANKSPEYIAELMEKYEEKLKSRKEERIREYGGLLPRDKKEVRLANAADMLKPYTQDVINLWVGIITKNKELLPDGVNMDDITPELMVKVSENMANYIWGKPAQNKTNIKHENVKVSVIQVVKDNQPDNVIEGNVIRLGEDNE